ncbi:MAG: hypothetical protein JO208_09560 [Alphaproteobacteria bacterium]|nr:hypothetical protein [Alphaproteobacteria bacterium]
MKMKTLYTSALVLAIAASPALSFEKAAYSADSSVAVGHHRHLHGVRLPRELRIMWHREERAKLKELPKEQRHGWLRAKWRAMSDAERHKKIAELEVKWKALPVKVREALLEKKRQKHEARQLRRAERPNSNDRAWQPSQQ